jgi:hypothetical protein
MVRKIRVPDQGTDAEAAAGKFLDGIKADTVDVNELGGALNVKLHQIEERGPASDEAGVLITGCIRRLGDIGGAEIAEEFHGDSCIKLLG